MATLIVDTNTMPFVKLYSHVDKLIYRCIKCTTTLILQGLIYKVNDHIFVITLRSNLKSKHVRTVTAEPL